MSAKRRFDATTLRRLAEIEEIDIETRATPRARPRRTTIWVVVTDGDVFVRSIRGSAGVWYRELRQHPLAVVHAGRTSLRVRASAVRSAAALRRASGAFRRKYRGSPSLGSVLAPHTLAGTLRLDPAD